MSHISSVAPAQIAEVADATADRLTTIGHWKGDGQGPGGELCALNSLHEVTDIYVAHCVERELETLLGLTPTPDTGLCALAYWNDNDATADEVVQAFRDLATKLRPDEAPGA